MAPIDAETAGRWQREADAARERFARTLVAWAGDMLELRRRGMDRLQWGSAIAADCTSATISTQADGSIVPMNRAA